MTEAPNRTTGGPALAVDLGVVGIVSAAICLAADRLEFMTAFVPLVLALRFAVWARLPRNARDGTVAEEAVFFVLCIGLGAFNDWSSVVRHGIYDYSVPVYLPELSTIPIWMLLFWGMILRCMATVARHRGLGAPNEPDPRIWLGRHSRSTPWVRIGIELLLVLATRQLIYRLYGDPWASWLPFAVAIAVHAWLLRPTPHDRKLMALVLVAGPLIEILYIQVAGLHRYELGWLGGVPVWIALWWVLAVVIWKDLSLRMHEAIGVALGPRRSPSPRPASNL